MANTLGEDALNVGAEGSARVPCLRIVRRVRGGCLADAEDVCPLFDFFPEVLRVKSGVSIIKFVG